MTTETNTQAQYKPRPTTARQLGRDTAGIDKLLANNGYDVACMCPGQKLYAFYKLEDEAQQEDPTVAYDRAMKVVA